MKRVLSCILLVAMLICVFPMNCYAMEDNSKTVTYFEDGSYEIEKIETRAMRSAGSVTGTKTKTRYASDGTLDWEAVLEGTFTFNGSSATCTSSSCDVSVYDNAWYTVSKSAGRSGSSATASVTMGRKSLGVTVEKVPFSMKLTCDADGNLS